MNGMLKAAALLCIAALFVFGCSSGTPSDLTTDIAAQALKAGHGDPHYIYLKFSGIKPDSALGQQLKGLIDTGVFVYEWGDVKRVYVPKDKAAAAEYAQGDIQIYLDGQLSATLAVEKVFLDKVIEVKAKKEEAVVRYSERMEPAPLYEAIMADSETKAEVEQARTDKTIPQPGEKEARLVKEQGVWKLQE